MRLTAAAAAPRYPNAVDRVVDCVCVCLCAFASKPVAEADGESRRFVRAINTVLEGGFPVRCLGAICARRRASR